MRSQVAIEDHALLSDCHSMALVTREATVDWWCAPRVDDASVFGALLDADAGGACSIAVGEPTAPPRRRYLDGTVVLETLLTDRDGVLRILDCLALGGSAREPPGRLLRILEPAQGAPRVNVRVAPRFDYGAATPWVRQGAHGSWLAMAGDDGLQIAGDVPLAPERDRGSVLSARFTLRGRRRLLVRFVRPEVLDAHPPAPPRADALDSALAATISRWRSWSDRVRPTEVDGAGVIRSALTLRALTIVRTGAVTAAATTSLPESWEGRTWDYRASWVRDAAFAVQSLAQLGLPGEADEFSRFIQRSAAGSADELHIAYGVGGERRLLEHELPDVAGWRGIGPVRVGNAALQQHQSDALGELLELSWRRHQRGAAPGEDLWRFLCALVQRAAATWRGPDRGLWEWRGAPRHFVHSKTLCWVALDRGVRLAEDLGLPAPLARWRRERDACRAAILEHGCNDEGVFVQAFGHDALDAAVLRIPMVGLLPYDDERVIRTVAVVLERLADDGLVRRYDADDGLPGREGAFLPCTFWAVQVLARQGRHDDACTLFERALRTRNDVGLFSEEYDPRRQTALGNFPQALTHLGHIDAALGLGSTAALSSGG